MEWNKRKSLTTIIVMLIQMVRFVFVLTGAIIGYQTAMKHAPLGLFYDKQFALILFLILGSAIGYVIGGVFGRRLVRTMDWVEDALQKIPTTELVLGTAGLIIGLVTSYLVCLPFRMIEPKSLRLSATALVYAGLSWLGLRLGAGRRDEFKQFFQPAARATPNTVTQRAARDKLLDTNILIDGRVIDVVDTGLVEGKLVVPRFVLAELQAIADSKDILKRSRGRRGLDVLSALQQKPGVCLEIKDTDYAQAMAVDAKLARMAKETGAILLTNDLNLCKVAQVEGATTANLNELANALKVAVLPGEEMAVKIVREGKESGQGVAYLDDGTMVVVDGGQFNVGQNVNIMVTSVLQTSSGKMIFSKIKTPVSA